MLNKIKSKLKKNVEILALGFLFFITVISTTYYNYNKKIIYNNYKNTLNNIYLKKTYKGVVWVLVGFIVFFSLLVILKKLVNA